LAKIRSFISIENLDPEICNQLVDKTLLLYNNQLPYSIKNQFVTSLFFEPSTRTHLSFQLAAAKLGIHLCSLDKNNSSIQKGESYLDTFLNLNALGFSHAIIRLKDEFKLKEMQSQLENHLVPIKLISAGEGMISHPSQALLDFCLIEKYFKSTQPVTILYIGDLAHSRVYSSHLQWHKYFPHFKCLTHDLLSENPLEEKLKIADVVYLFRPQVERHSQETMLSLETYTKKFCITMERFQLLKKTSIVMHPGPNYKNVEFDDSLLFNEKFKIMEQVSIGVFARMAIYLYCMGEL